MAILDIVQYPHPVLLKKADPVGDIQNTKLQTLIDDMIATLHTVPGIGLAAPQVGQSLRLFVFDLSIYENAPYQGPHVVIYPEILEIWGEDRSDEGCLSLSDAEYREIVPRPAFVRLKGFDRTGMEQEWQGEGIVARLFQHEVDHLNGMLIIHRLSSLKRDIFFRKWKKQRP